MKGLYSILICFVVFSMLASVATADTWDKRIIVNRFTPVITGVTVLDQETGLVWEVNPSTARRSWVDAQIECYNRTRAARKGWRLPTIRELLSLVDPSVPFPDPNLPSGHPFRNITLRESLYWSATTNNHFTGEALLVDFQRGGMDSRGKDMSFGFWCVRGGQAEPFTRWDKRINDATQRFTSALLDPTTIMQEPQAILDNETGLVWELVPEFEPHDWFFVSRVCNNKTIGGRKGWRLPTVHELTSLVDPRQRDSALPLGHPFHTASSTTIFPDVRTNIPYWTANTIPVIVGDIRELHVARVSLFDGSVLAPIKVSDDSINREDVGGFNLAWCVRGGLQDFDNQ